MYDIAIIGGSLSGLISSINLSSDYRVCIIDINQEIGFPTNFPGLSKNIDLVNTILHDQDKSNLYLQKTDIGWGHQIRSYVLQPYQLVKDLRNKTESTNPSSVLDGNIDQFIEEGIKSK